MIDEREKGGWEKGVYDQIAALVYSIMLQNSGLQILINSWNLSGFTDNMLLVHDLIFNYTIFLFKERESVCVFDCNI